MTFEEALTAAAILFFCGFSFTAGMWAGFWIGRIVYERFER